MRESSTLEGPKEPAKSRQVERAALHCNKEKRAWGQRRRGVGSDTRARSLGDKEQAAGARVRM